MISSMFKPLATAARLAAVARPPIPWAAGIASALALNAALGAIPPLLTGRIIDALQALDAGRALRELAAFAALTLLVAVTSFAVTYASTIFRESVVRNLRVFLMGKLLRARLDALEQLTLGEIANRVDADIYDFSSRFEYSLFPTISGLCALAATAASMFLIDARFALVALGAAALIVLPTKMTMGRNADIVRAQREVEDRLVGTITESANLSALTLLRNVRAAAREMTRYAALADRFKDLRRSQALLNGTAGIATTIVNLVGPVAVLGLGAYLLLHHAVSVGTIVAFLMYLSRLYAPVAGLAILPVQLSAIRVAVERILQIADMQEESSGGRPFADGPLRLDGVDLVRGGRTILASAHLEIAPGARAAVVGPSGSGKSTLVTLLLRLWDPTRGALRIGETDLREIELGSLRDAVAVVAQDALVFDTTLRENLTYTNPCARAGDIDRAIGICRLGEVVRRLPDGLETRLGQRGRTLSGGERQRVCLARAILQAPRVLVLDEALTGVDVDMEAAIVDELRRALRDTTLLVVTHRLSSVREFDHIVVVEEGRIVASGTHAAALVASTWYRTTSQAREPDRFPECVA